MKKIIVDSIEKFIKEANLFNVKTYNMKDFGNDLCIYFSNYTNSLNNKIAGNINYKTQVAMIVDKNLIEDVKIILATKNMKLLKHKIYEFNEKSPQKILKIAGLFNDESEFLEDTVDRKIEYEEEFLPGFEEWLDEVKSKLSDEALQQLGGEEGLTIEEKYYYEAREAYVNGRPPIEFVFKLLEYIEDIPGENEDFLKDMPPGNVEYIDTMEDIVKRNEYTDLE